MTTVGIPEVASNQQTGNRHTGGGDLSPGALDNASA